MEFIKVIIVQGLTFGSIYGLSALGFAVLYNTTGIFHLAYGALAILGFLIAASLNTGEAAGALTLSVLAAMAAVFAATALVFGGYKLLERRGTDRLGIFVASLGVAYAIEALMLLGFGPSIRIYFIPDLLRIHTVAGFPVSHLVFITVASAFGAFALVMLAIRKTRWGYRVQGIASNPELSELVGIRISATLLGVYAVAAICSVWAATLLGMFTTITSASGTSVVLFAAIAVIAAGRGTYAGGFLLAMALGFVQPIFTFYISDTWALCGVFGVMLALLLLRPSGLSRSAAAVR